MVDKFEFTEFVKCAQDPVYFTNTYAQVFNIKEQMITKIECFEYQEQFLSDLHNHRNNIVLKSRQTGISVITACFVAWKLIFNEDERILVVADNAAGAVRFLSHVRNVLDNLPEFLLPDFRLSDNTKKIAFSNGSWVEAKASSKQAGRGDTLTMLILDEVAFIEHADDIWKGAGLALAASGGKCVMISTPNGTGGLYHTTWVAAEKKEGMGGQTFHPSKIHWTQHPIFSKGLEYRYDENGKEYPTSPWYENECERMNHNKVAIAQELDLSFEGSGALVIDNDIVTRYEKACIDKKPICHYNVKKDEYGFVDKETTFIVWEKPVEGRNYVVGADVGRGDGSDYSTIQVIDVNNLTQVAEFQGKLPPDEFGYLIKAIGMEYNEAYLAIECNSFGLATTLTLKNQIKYKTNRMYHSKSAVKLYNRTNNLSVEQGAEIPGFQTTTKTRPLIVSTLIKYMRDNLVTINSNRLVSEFKTFIYKSTKNGVKAEHGQGAHDDLVFAFGIALLIRDTEIENVFYSKEVTKAMLDSISQSSTSLKGSSFGEKTKKGYEDDEDFNDTSWLYGPISSG